MSGKHDFPYGGVNLLDRPHRPSLHALAIVIIAVSGSLLARPIVQTFFWQGGPRSVRAAETRQLAATLQVGTTSPDELRQPIQPPAAASPLPISSLAKPNPTPLPVPKPSAPGNRLIIPSIAVDMPMVDGTDATIALRQGAWRLPLAGNPQPGEAGKNVVLAGHRWYRTSGPNTLFRLNLVQTGDLVVVAWEGREYRYQVTSVVVVDPRQIEVLQSTGETMLTIFTCTPLFSTKQRLVVVAKPIP